MRISPIYNTVHYKIKTVRKFVVKPSKVKDVTEDYKKSLLTKKPVEVKSRFPNTDTKVWEPQPKPICIGRGADGVKLYQYVSAKLGRI
tara:strand:+ start:43 stop:306 length:264 start_codon:yes stop_codon:yes gene_type:complete